MLTGAVPKGPVTDDAFNRITSELIQQLQSAPKLDGRLRNALGPKFPIVVTHDFHAKVSQEIVDLTTALSTYKESPLIDTWDRDVQAARIMSGVVPTSPRSARAS